MVKGASRKYFVFIHTSIGSYAGQAGLPLDLYVLTVTKRHINAAL